MLSRFASAIVASALLLPALGGCKTVYSDTFAYKKNSFKAPPAKQIEIKAPTENANPLEGGGAGGLVPGNPMGIPGAPAPDAGGIPGGGPAIPGLPEAAPVPGVPGTPAIPGLN